MGHWQKFTTVGYGDMREEEDRLEITCALMMGARFTQQSGKSQPWTCIDDELTADYTGWWVHKANAARAYLSTKGIFFTREGELIPPT